MILKEEKSQREFKFRYTWKRISDGHIYQTITPIECLEGKGDVTFLGNDLWELFARDLFTGKTDALSQDIFENDIMQIIHPASEGQTEDIVHTGRVVWSDVYCRFEIEGYNCHPNNNWTKLGDVYNPL